MEIEPHRTDDPIAPVRGIVNGLLLALPFWIFVMLAWWLS